MTEKNRTRNVQKEALFEVLQESNKDKKLQIELETLHKLAIELEEQAYQTSNQEINKDYRQKINTIKVRLKGEKGQLLRKVLIDKLLIPRQLMMMDMNNISEDAIIQYLKSQGITLQKETQMQKPKQPINPKQIISPINTQQKKQFETENQQNEYEAISEIKTNNDQTPALQDGQVGDMMESQAQIKFFLEELDKKQFNQQIENKDDEIEQYDEILNTPLNFEQNTPKSKQNKNQQQTQEQEIQKSAEPLPEEDKVNQEIIQDDIDISQSKLCKSLLRNIEEKNQQNDDLELINALYNEISKLRQQNKELQIQNQQLNQQLIQQKSQSTKEFERSKLIFENEIDQLKSQLQLAKNFKIFDYSSQINLSFSQRQTALQEQMNQFIQDFNQRFSVKHFLPDVQEQQIISNVKEDNDNLEINFEKSLTIQKQQTSQTQEQHESQQQQTQHTQIIQLTQQTIEEIPTITNNNHETQEQKPLEKNIEIPPQIKKETKSIPPPPAKRTARPPPQNKQSQEVGKKVNEPINQASTENIDNSEDFFNQLSLNSQQQQISLVQQQQFLTQEQNLHQNDNQMFQQNPFEQSQKSENLKPQKQVPKQRRAIQGTNGVQNVPSSLFD